jgi:hypothetical protein
MCATSTAGPCRSAPSSLLPLTSCKHTVDVCLRTCRVHSCSLMRPHSASISLGASGQDAVGRCANAGHRAAIEEQNPRHTPEAPAETARRRTQRILSGQEEQSVRVRLRLHSCCTAVRMAAPPAAARGPGALLLTSCECLCVSACARMIQIDASSRRTAASTSRHVRRSGNAGSAQRGTQRRKHSEVGTRAQRRSEERRREGEHVHPECSLGVRCFTIRYEGHTQSYRHRARLRSRTARGALTSARSSWRAHVAVCPRCSGQ